MPFLDAELKPYLIWLKIGGAVVCIGLLIWLGVWIKGTFDERDRLRQDKAVLQTQLKDAENSQQFMNSVTTAIGQIKIRSNTYVQQIESDPKPVFHQSTSSRRVPPPLVFIPGGLLSDVHSLYSSATPGRGPAGGPPGGNPSPVKPAGGILPDRPGP